MCPSSPARGPPAEPRLPDERPTHSSCLHNLSAPGTSVRRPSFKLTLQVHGRDQATTPTKLPARPCVTVATPPGPSALRPALVPLWPPGHCDNQDAESPAYHIQMQGRSAFRDPVQKRKFPVGWHPSITHFLRMWIPIQEGEPPHGLSNSPQEPLREADWTPQ